MDPLIPPITLLVKLGSLAVHVEEYLSPNKHYFDLREIQILLHDGEVREWLELMDKQAFLPKKR